MIRCLLYYSPSDLLKCGKRGGVGHHGNTGGPENLSFRKVHNCTIPDAKIFRTPCGERFD